MLSEACVGMSHAAARIPQFSISRAFIERSAPPGGLRDPSSREGRKTNERQNELIILKRKDITILEEFNM